MTIPTLETKRLRLRPFREEDAVALHRIVSAEGMLKYFPGSPEPTLGRSERLVRHQIEQWTTLGYAWWAVELKATGQLAGWNGLQYLPDTKETEIGFLIDKALWGQGLTTEGGCVGLEYGFRELGMTEIIALAHPENGASRRVIEKLGMQFDRVTEYFGVQLARYTLSAAGHERCAAQTSRRA
jgi:ribosomal-protein-alanine N-acetyltransferase